MGRKKRRREKEPITAGEAFADAMLECAYSEEGCWRIPLRMVAVMNDDPNDSANVDLILLCKVHAPFFVPTGRVVFDKALVKDEKILEML